MLEYFTGICIKLSLNNAIDSNTIKALVSELNCILDTLFSVSISHDFFTGDYLLSFTTDGNIDLNDSLALKIFISISKLYKCRMNIEKCVNGVCVYNKLIEE